MTLTIAILTPPYQHAQNAQMASFWKIITLVPLFQQTFLTVTNLIKAIRFVHFAKMAFGFLPFQKNAIPHFHLLFKIATLYKTRKLIIMLKISIPVYIVMLMPYQKIFKIIIYASKTQNYYISASK